MVLAPLLPLGLHTLLAGYKFIYRSYYLYAILAAIQSQTCNWVSTPSVMCINAVINYMFDPETANDILKGIFWFSCKIVQSAGIITDYFLDRCGGYEGIKK